MSELRRHVFKIETLSREKLAMRELAGYIMDLADLLGHHESVHCQDVRGGSVEVVFNVEPPSTEHVIERLLGAPCPNAEPSVHSAYVKLNRRLKGHGASARIMEHAGETIRTLVEFPGNREKAEEALPLLWGAGTVDGIPTRVGDRHIAPSWVPVHIADSGTVVNCEARKPIAIEIARHLLMTPIRASGQGRWRHDEAKGWRLDKFRIESFAPLDPRPVADVVKELREIYAKTDWARMDDPISHLHSIRHDE